MDLRDHIAEIQENLREGQYLNEAQVSQGIVLRILQATGWPVFDSQVVSPEFAVENRRVDFALCHPKGKPVVFLEVKKVGGGQGADLQLFEYAYLEGVPLAILTDGQEWNFYLPAGQGRPPDRRVYRLDLIARNPAESADFLDRYLAHSRVCSGEALESARSDYQNVARDREVRETLPIAWKKLLEERGEILIELVQDKVESICGYRPDSDSVEEFIKLRTTILEGQKPDVNKIPSEGGTSEKPADMPNPPSSGAFGFRLNGSEVRARNGRDVLIKVLNALANQDASFCERFSARPKHGRSRRYIDRKKENLYPGRPDLSQYSHHLNSGYWISTNYSRENIRQILKMASEVAGLRFEEDLVVFLG